MLGLEAGIVIEAQATMPVVFLIGRTNDGITACHDLLRP
jgi:hypothetical protein